MLSWIRNHALTLVAISLFFVTFVGQIVAGRADYNQDQLDHGESPVGVGEYFSTGHFGEATFENWESEFLQMAVFIFLTAFLVEAGAADSRKPSYDPQAGKEPFDEDPEKHRADPTAPWPVRRGGLALTLYRNSLSLVLFILFLISFAGHAVTGAVEFSGDEINHGGEAVATLAYIRTPHFWFESFQNWQSEFLSVFCLTFFSIWLRQQGSPESKPVHAPHSQTGAE